MRRREFIALIGGAGATWPFAAQAQQQGGPVIGFLSNRSAGESAYVVAAFRRGLAEAGYVEGRNVAIEYRWAEGLYDRLPALAADLIGLRVAVLFAAGGPPSALAAQAATSTVPIVFSAASDPVRLGLVSSLARPGGNVTGMSTLTTGLGAKSVELMKELLPTATAIAYLINPSNPSAVVASHEALAMGSALGIQVHVLDAASEHDLEAAYAALVELRAGGLIVYGDPFFDSQRDRIVALSARHAVPATYAWREYALAGGLMSYGSSLTDSYRQAGIYVGRVLKGEKPADLPVQEPAKFELVVNLKTAKALGLTVPASLHARADEVIE
jgi:putative tryptophan/tyrosine transport system substrate-binding protein